STCMLVEIIATKSQDIEWKISLDGERISREKIRRVSIDKFYEIVTGDSNAFKNLCQTLPLVIADSIKLLNEDIIKNSVSDELQTLANDVLTSLYLLAFKTYEGFSNFKIMNNLG
ncbi:MAG: Eco47II family restriction endonuclease, partial [Burkholderiales bacterium]|nr:Eco47II family restriction endonuclease [Burkholderiales bacterium]